MTRTPRWIALAAVATALTAAPLSVSAQEVAPTLPGATLPAAAPAAATADDQQWIIVGWQDDDGGPIYGTAADIQRINQERAQAQLQQLEATQPDLFAGAPTDE